MEARVIWREHMAFEGRSEGFSIPMDATRPLGHFYGPNPKEVLLSALGACAGMDVVGLLKKHHEFIDRFEIQVEADQETKKYPRIFKEIKMTFHLEGAIEPGAAFDAIQRSQNTYSGVSAMICETVPLHWHLVLNGEDIGEGFANFSQKSGDFLHSSYDG